MMKTTWILAAHRGGAKLYEHTGNGPLALLRDIPHPEGRLQNRELRTDRPGREGEGGGPARSAKTSELDPIEEEALDFARSLGDMLSKGRVENSYERLVLVAEPRFLGRLRGVLDSHTLATVAGTVNKELTNAPADDLRETLRDQMLL